MSQQAFQWFCELPVMYHAYHVRATAHFDSEQQRLQRYEQPTIIWHKMKAIQHLNVMLGNLDPAAIETIMAAIFCLDYSEIDAEYFTQPNYFDPPTPPLAWMKPCWNNVRPQYMHAQAMYALLDTLGGLHKVQNVFFAVNIARCVR